MPLKFLITGAPSSGKTTLLKSLSEIPGIFTIEETARSILAEHPELQEKREFQDFLLQEQLRLEEEAERKGCSVIVCDRGWIDVIVFSRYFGHEPNVELQGKFKPYDGIFLCSPEGITPTKEDATRQRRNEREELHALTLEVLQELGFDYQLLVGPKETRLSQALETIRRVSGLENLQPNLWKEGQGYRSARKEML